MAIWDIFRQQYVDGKVLDKYRLTNGDIGLIVEDSVDQRRYHVEFNDGRTGLNNFYGLFKTSFENKSDPLDKLIAKGDYIGVTLYYSRSPFRQANQLHSVFPIPQYRAPINRYNQSRLFSAPY